MITCLRSPKTNIRRELQKVWETLEKVVNAQTRIMKLVEDLSMLYRREFDWDITDEGPECVLPESPTPVGTPMKGLETDF